MLRIYVNIYWLRGSTHRGPCIPLEVNVVDRRHTLLFSKCEAQERRQQAAPNVVRRFIQPRMHGYQGLAVGVTELLLEHSSKTAAVRLICDCQVSANHVCGLARHVTTQHITQVQKQHATTTMLTGNALTLASSRTGQGCVQQSTPTCQRRRQGQDSPTEVCTYMSD